MLGVLESSFPWLLYISLEQNLLEQLLKGMGAKTSCYSSNVQRGADWLWSNPWKAQGTL